MDFYNIKTDRQALHVLLKCLCLSFNIYFFHFVFLFFQLLKDNKDLYAEEAAAQRERDRQRMLSIPGLIAPNEIQDEMVDS